MTNEFLEIAINKQKEIASGKQLTHEEYLLFREWFFRQRKDVGRRMAARNFDFFFSWYGMNVNKINNVIFQRFDCMV